MEDGQTLFDYNVGLNDIVQLLIRSQTDPPDSPSLNNGEGVACAVAPPTTASVPASATPTSTVVSPATIANSNGNGSNPCSPVSDSEPSTSSRTLLIDPGIGLFKVNELVDCRDVSIGAWFEGVIEKVSPASKAQNSRARVGRPSKRTNNKLEPETSAAPSSSSSSSSTALNSDGSEPSTSKTDPAHVSYHIKYEDYPENGVVEMSAGDVRPRARTLLRFDQLQVGELVMVNYNLENPEERGFWYDAEIAALNAVSRTNKEIRVRILLGGAGDVIGDCKLQFLDEIYRIEKPGAPGLSAADGPFKRKSGPECKHCKADPDTECRFCSCCVCGGKQDAHMQLLCDECNMAFHIYCLTPPLTSIPEDEDWYCPTCKNDSSEVVKAGEKLRTSKKKSKMPSATTESQRDWGKGMACVGRTKECTIVPSNHYGPVPGVPVGTTWKFRVQVSEAGVHRPHVGGIHGRSNDGSYSLVLAGGFEDEVDRGDEFTYTGSGGRDLSGNKRIGEHSFDQTLTHMNSCLSVFVCVSQYPPGYLEAMANKTKREATVRSVGGSTRGRKRGRPRTTRPSKRVQEEEEEKPAENTEEELQSNGSADAHEEEEENTGVCEPQEEPQVKRLKEVESFVLSEQQRNLIQDDEPNRKLWDEALSFLSEGPNFLRKVEQLFMCVCCQELSFQPVTTECSHNVCKMCLQRSFRAEVFSCPACRHDLGKDYVMTLNKTLQLLLDQFFPGYSKGR
ncbi:E3 ubiquitin-protein ligase UHRF2-like [Sinocyclocheilus grahami]|uniref:E3 ubiquitin-protein ligase UHRF2-like n=1 Tax=Sinocyclocheilus grahami TaxID=75366 RepID=UPI0007AD3400|nr:PREDICTED: E3 ubiquitin-protein ligase UHRF2-like [Sinocyclocheilus grahami]